MIDYSDLHRQVYEQGHLFGVEQLLPRDPLRDVKPGVRPNSIAIEGGAFGDEGKGKCVDELAARLAREHGKVIVYRWNGGANAGHTVEFEGHRVALHQVPSGAFIPGATVILGKGMVLHPADLVTELDQVATLMGPDSRSNVWVDEMAVLCLDTHRAFEAALNQWQEGGRGATGRGIAPAYADIVYRHPLRMRDLKVSDWQTRIGRHYDLYAGWMTGLGANLSSTTVPALQGTTQVGSRKAFLQNLGAQRNVLLPYIRDVSVPLHEAWMAASPPFIFEGAQAVGLDARFGVYPDVTASDPTLGGILASTEGLVLPRQIAVRAAALKATYTSSVGTRRLPTRMDEELAQRIREAAQEYGTTTHRPRDIVHLDLPALRFYARVSDASHLILTHMDIAYPNESIRVCTFYTDRRGNSLPYRPDQEYLKAVVPHYVELPSWDGAALRNARKPQDLPLPAQQFVAFVSQALGATPLFATIGPQRDETVSWLP